MNPVYIYKIEQIHAVDGIADGDSNQPRSALAPGSFGGDDEWAASGFLFWPLVGFLLGQAQRRGRRAAIVLLMAAHYAIAVFHLSQSGMGGGAGFARAWSALPVQVVLFCLVYAAANIAVWMVTFRKPADRA